ncbi:DMT family transporter [Sulfitobacter albidus]|uniref:DMT family transporter n=1 Tax=Sulfitobacter albidus TaxID=2829501 RepID=A0A975JC38_9RHOB|nr:DMT family transporter [Sulfitobacter albidus]QUJ75520.1 DMT family transporter [Sulfitobacter albidus]
MRLILMTALTMLAFAANSLLTRAAIDAGGITPQAFALIRVLAGAATLAGLVALRGGALPLMRRARLPGAISLTVYMIGFSLAYLTLDAGLGALILFGVTQITMFGYGAVTGAAPTVRQLTGAAVAFAGLVLVLWPGAQATTDPLGAALMVLAGVGWGAYSLVGRGAAEPLAATAANFILCFPMLLLLFVAFDLRADAAGTLLAVVCGAVTSGLGYALWYSVLPRMQGATAAVVQLSVPVLAILAGALLLGEAITPVIALSAALVVGGIGWAVTARR